MVKLTYFVRVDSDEEHKGFLMAGFIGGCAFGVVAAVVGGAARQGVVLLSAAIAVGMHVLLSLTKRR